MSKTATIDEAWAAKAWVPEISRRLGAVAGITRVDDGYGLKVNLREPLRSGVAPPTAVEGAPGSWEPSTRANFNVPNAGRICFSYSL